MVKNRFNSTQGNSNEWLDEGGRGRNRLQQTVAEGLYREAWPRIPPVWTGSRGSKAPQ